MRFCCHGRPHLITLISAAPRLLLRWIRLLRRVLPWELLWGVLRCPTVGRRCLLWRETCETARRLTVAVAIAEGLRWLAPTYL